MLIGLSNPIDMIYHVQPGMIVFLLPLAVYIEGWPTFVNGKQAEIFYTLMDNFVWVIGGSLLAFFLESSEYLVVTYTSSLTLSVSGVFKVSFLIHFTKKIYKIQVLEKQFSEAKLMI